eukprot:gene18209-23023_t
MTVASFLAIALANRNSSVNGTHVLRVTVPSSLNTVAIDVSHMGSSYSNSVLGVLLSVIQLSPSFFPTLTVTTSSTSNHSSVSNSSMTVSYQLSSEVVTVQVVSVNANRSSTTVSLPTFETTLQLTDATYYVADRTQLRVNCTLGVPSTASLYCRQSKVWMNVTCTGAASAVVRRRCPVAQTVCTVVNVQSNAIISSDYCQATTVGSSVVCRC